jgi:hypothetical protein
MKSKISEFINYSLGVIGILTGAYFYFASVKERIPTFIIDPIKTTIVDKELVKDKPLKIFDIEGKEITMDVNVLTFYFFNQGNESIKPENILTELKLSLPDDCQIIDYKILKASRPVTKIELVKTDSLKNSIEIKFRILETSDGLTGQIIYLGSKESNLVLSGDIEGVKHISSTVNKVNIGMLFLALFSLIYFFIFYFLIKLRFKLREPYQLIIRSEKNLAEKSTLTFTYMRLLVGSIILFLLIFISSLILSKTLLSRWFDPKYKQTLKNEIPSEVLPNN